jgi:predicted dehydrogenase
MAKRLGIGVVGAGFNGTFHIKSFLGVRNADILGVTSRTIEKAEKAAKVARDLGVGEAKAYKTVTDMVKAPEIDAIWICSPNTTRIQVMEEIAAAGKGKLLGIACEKPLARDVKEARRVVELAKGFNTGYLENQVFAPMVTRGRQVIWARGASAVGRPYLARAAEEHGGPHEAWFWRGKDAGGGVLNDMLCHALECARYLLTDPKETRDSLTIKTISAEIATLKWARPDYVKKLKSSMGVDWGKHPSEDFARATITWEDEAGNPVMAEVTGSWSYSGPGLRLTLEMLGPEYSLQGTSLNNHLSVFFSREVAGKAGEDIVEKQTAEQGLMPLVADEPGEYGYQDENRHMVERFLAKKKPELTFEDGLEVTRILMACYMSAERGERLAWPPAGLDEYVPPAARETYTSKDVFKGKK